jgi:hypothetical protein
MRLPRFRLRITVRRLMVAVAVVALLIGVGVEVERRRERYSRLARQHAVVRDELHKFLMIVPPSASVEFFGDRKAIAALVGYHGRLKEKYERAARDPWFPVEPDPPEPK